MAIVRIPKAGRTIDEPEVVRAELASIGITHERWVPAHEVAKGAPPEEILAAYGAEVDRLKQEGGYVIADVIDVTPQTPGLEAMLERFRREHWHDEDEVRFVIEGSGVFHVRPRTGQVRAIEVHPGDLLRVPRGTWHWFDLCASRRIRAIRLFQDPSGWTPHYTDSRAETGFEPICLGPRDVRAS